MYGRLFAVLRAQGYRQVTAGITEPNPASAALHRRFGLERIGVRRGIGWKFDRWHDVSLWQGSLLPPTDGDDGPPAPIRPVDEVWSTAVGPG